MEGTGHGARVASNLRVAVVPRATAKPGRPIDATEVLQPSRAEGQPESPAAVIQGWPNVRCGHFFREHFASKSRHLRECEVKPRGNPPPRSVQMVVMVAWSLVELE